MRTLALWLCATTSALAGSITPWGGATGANTAAFAPYFFVDGGGATPVLYGFVGAGDHVDFMAGAGTTFSADGVATPSFEGMARFFPTDSFGLAAHVLATPGEGATFGPEAHFATGAGAFTFTGNVGWWTAPTERGDLGAGDAWGVFGPEVAVSDKFTVFAEVNPSVALSDGSFAMTVVPGATLTLGDHWIAAGVYCQVLPERSATLGLAYGRAFDLAPKHRLLAESVAATE